jgi:hypothetical protein
MPIADLSVAKRFVVTSKESIPAVQSNLLHTFIYYPLYNIVSSRNEDSKSVILLLQVLVLPMYHQDILSLADRVLK